MSDKQRIPSAPITINWTLTFRCNFNCMHCYSRVEKAEELDTAQVKEIMRKVAVYKVPFINYGGGEPLLRKDLFELTEYATSLGYNVSMNTNAFLMTKEKAKKAQRVRLQDGRHIHRQHRPGSPRPLPQHARQPQEGGPGGEVAYATRACGSPSPRSYAG